MLMWMHNLTHRHRVGADTTAGPEHPDAVKHLEDRIKGGLGNPELLPVYKKDAERLRELSDDELVYIDRLHPGLGAAAELSRRTMDATRELKRSLDSANNRIYWLTAVIGLYTVLLAIATLVLVFTTR
jgi:hypothetical protein